MHGGRLIIWILIRHDQVGEGRLTRLVWSDWYIKTKASIRSYRALRRRQRKGELLVIQHRGSIARLQVDRARNSIYFVLICWRNLRHGLSPDKENHKASDY